MADKKITITPMLQQKKFSKSYAKTLALLTIVSLFAINLLPSITSEPSQIIISDNAYSQCKFNQALQHAQRLGLTVENTDRFGWYNFIGKQQAVNEFQQWFFSRDKQSTTDDIHTQTCQVHHLRQLAKNAKPALMPYIPDNADYVSYHPTQNKAVYCHYKFSNVSLSGDKPNANIGSQCEFLTMEYNQVVSYDISDMERNNIDGWKNNRYYPYDIYQANSYVAKWEDKPTSYFGFQLLTAINYANFGIGQNY
ncbi:MULTISPECIES: hypothetical protein [unclassified Moraxella]|uniref:hypothetical protein n=1 Tax=unclassified Moraxella TaxID=2685852 RepID=UPI003AF5D76A